MDQIGDGWERLCSVYRIIQEVKSKAVGPKMNSTYSTTEQ